MNINLYSIHGLVRGNRIELGRDADTGGQIRYVVDLARSLSHCPEVTQVNLITRKITDSCVSLDYAADLELLSPKAQIVRIPCGPAKYLRKELLWPHLNEFAERSISFLNRIGSHPNLIHGHYVDAGIVGQQVAQHFKVPLLFTAHSLGKPKLKMLLDQGISRAEANSRFAIDHRIAQEQAVLDNCNLVVTSTRHEAQVQYSNYQIPEGLKFEVISPGTQVDRFFPYDGWNCPPRLRLSSPKVYSSFRQSVRTRLNGWLDRFLSNPSRPMILSICRPDNRKNLSALVELYGESRELQRLANLVIVAGNRNDISALPEKERGVFIDLLMSMDRYDLYGKMALPKRHCADTDVPELMRMAAERGGVFVNPAHFELFGLTCIESAAVGLPYIATNNGGPVDIADRTQGGIVVDVHNLSQFTAAIKLLLTDRELWQQISTAGIHNVRQKYQWANHCEIYLRAIRNVIVSPQTSLLPMFPNGQGRVDEALTKSSTIVSSLKFHSDRAMSGS